MFLHRCTPSSSLVDSLSKASYLARPYVLGHGDSVMWKEHRIILGLQTPAGAIQSKFGLRGDPELLSCVTGHAQPSNEILLLVGQKQVPESLCSIPKLALPVHSLNMHPERG